MVGIVMVSLAARSSLADHYHVPSGSMRPSVEVGDRLVVNKLAFGLRVPWTSLYLWETEGPARGDVVVLTSPEEGIVLLKRVVAVPGDRVEVRGGRLSLNGAPVPIDDDGHPWLERLETRVHPVRITRRGGPAFGPRLLGPREYLVMGDNRGESRDGRIFGPVDRSLLLGRALGIYRRDGSFTWQGV